MKIKVTLGGSFTDPVHYDNDGPHLKADGLRISLLPHLARRNFGPQDLMIFLFEQLDAVGSSLLASYLYERIKNGTFRQIFIEDDEVPLDMNSAADYEKLILAALEEE